MGIIIYAYDCIFLENWFDAFYAIFNIIQNNTKDVNSFFCKFGKDVLKVLMLKLGSYIFEKANSE